jgi:hypothetical protein
MPKQKERLLIGASKRSLSSQTIAKLSILTPNKGYQTLLLGIFRPKKGKKAYLRALWIQKQNLERTLEFAQIFRQNPFGLRFFLPIFRVAKKNARRNELLFRNGIN